MSDCTCVRCADCGGSGFTTGRYSDDPDEVEACSNCYGRGVAEVCEACYGDVDQ